MEDPMAIDKKLIDQLLTDYKKPEDRGAAERSRETLRFLHTAGARDDFLR